MQRHSVTSLETARSLANGPSWEGGGGGWGRSLYSAFPGNCSVSYLSFVYGRSLWAELNGGENSLHWKANMLPLFSIMTLWLRPYFLPWVSKNRRFVSTIQSLFYFFKLKFYFFLHKIWLQFTQNRNLKKEQRYGVKQLFLFEMSRHTTMWVYRLRRLSMGR